MKISLILLILTLCNNIFAQLGVNDPTFNPTDLGFGYGDGPNNQVYKTVVQTDGKILIGGEFTSYHGTTINRIARINEDGSLDLTFNVGTGANNRVNPIALQVDGKIIIGGTFTTYNGTALNRIARLNSDGSLDATFNVGSGANGTVHSIIVQVDGKILVGGSFTTFNGNTTNRIIRLNADGSLDATFNIGTGFNNSIYSMALQTDGKIVVGGFFTNFDGTSINRIARLNSNGSIDASFNVGTGFNTTVWSIFLQSDDKILVGGEFTNFNGSFTNHLTRLNTDGSLDGTFIPGTGPNAFVYTIHIQSDSKILIGGTFTAHHSTPINRIARLNSNGILDLSFNIGSGANSTVRSITLQADGKILAGGLFTLLNGKSRNFLERLNIDGASDETFNTGTGANNEIKSIAVQNDGKIIIGGLFTYFNGINKNYIARLNPNGSLDETFSIGTGANNNVRTIVIQDDGKILIGGDFTTFNGVSRGRIARLNSDGSLDASFDVGTGITTTNGIIYSIVIQTDGKIIIGGQFNTYNGTSRNNIARLNTDGSLDLTFSIGSGASSSIFSLANQPDDKILIAGVFNFYNGTASNRIARLNSDGSLDATFNVGTGANSTLTSLAIQTDGKILIGGYFTSYNGSSRNRLTRLNSDGSLDATFNVGSGANSAVESIFVQNDGNVLIGGQFTTFNGGTQNRIARLISDGSLDASFDVGTGSNNAVSAIAIQTDGKILIGGGFTAYNNTGRNRIARILIADPLPITLSFFSATCDGETTLIKWATASEYMSSHFIVQHSRDGIAWSDIAEILAFGTTNQEQNYSTLLPSHGSLSYFRLKQVDLNGKFEIFDPVSVNCELKMNSLEAYPNPIEEQFTLQIESIENYDNVVIQIIDNWGRVVSENTHCIQIGSTNVSFNGHSLQPGNYILRLQGLEDKFKPLRLVKS